MGVWGRYGLITPGVFNARAGDQRYALLPRASRFRLALEEQGGLSSVFGQFLSGRADLLPSPHLRQLSKIRAHRRASDIASLQREMPDTVSNLRLIRVAPAAEVFSGSFQDRPVVIEFYSQGGEPFDEKQLENFRRALRPLEREVEGRILHPEVLENFRDWLRIISDIERKRAILSNLERVPSGLIWRFPRLVPALQSPNCLVYEGADGIPVGHDFSAVSPAGKENLQRLVEGSLELCLLLSLVDAEAQPENMLLLPDGLLGFRAVPGLAPVPAEWSYELLQYMVCTVAGNSPRALHMLSRMSSNHDAYAGEQHLMRELSALQPELKINVVTPESVAALENYWRALAATHLRAPLFLELFHRQWTLLGQYNGDVAPAEDLIAESLWPVLGRILRYRFSEIMSLDKGREWISSSGLLLLTAARQLGATMEQIRDNDLAMIVERQEYESRDPKLNRRTVAVIWAALALTVFLMSLHYALNHAGATQVTAGIIATVSAAALTIFVARIE